MDRNLGSLPKAGIASHLREPRQLATAWRTMLIMKKPMPEDGPDPIDRHVGTRIRGRRVGLRISQTKLGQAIGVTFQQIQKYESGTNRVGASNLFKIAKALGVDVSFFFDGIISQLGEDRGTTPSYGLAEAPAPAFDFNPMNSREAFELMHNYFRIPDPTVRKRLFQLIRVLSYGEPEPALHADETTEKVG